MADIKISTQIIDRDELAKFVPLKSFRLIKFFENLAKDVSSTIPDAIGTAIQGPSGGSVDDNLVIFEGTSGTKVKDSGVNIDDVAQLESPDFTGSPTAPTPPPGDSTTRIATTAFVAGETAVLAPLDSPALTGIPTAPTAALGTNTTQLATTAFVQNAVDNLSANKASFSAHNNGVAQSIPNNVFTKLTFSTETYDVGSKFATSTWTPPAGRLVSMSGSAVIGVSALNAITTVAVYKNGAEFKRGSMIVPGGGNSSAAHVNCQDIPNGTDTYELWMLQSSGAAQNTIGAAAVTWFQGTTIQT